MTLYLIGDRVMRSINRTSLFLSAGCLSLLLASCGGSSVSSNREVEPPPQPRVPELTIDSWRISSCGQDLEGETYASNNPSFLHGTFKYMIVSSRLKGEEGWNLPREVLYQGEFFDRVAERGMLRAWVDRAYPSAPTAMVTTFCGPEPFEVPVENIHQATSPSW